MKEKILELLKYVIIIAIGLYTVDALNKTNDKVDKFKENQAKYEQKMDSLRVISEQLITNIRNIDTQIKGSKRAIDDLKKNPPVVNYTNVEALDFFRQFAAKYNTIFKDSL